MAIAREAGPKPTQTRSSSFEGVWELILAWLGGRERFSILRDDMIFSPLMAIGRSSSGELLVLIAEGAICSFLLNSESSLFNIYVCTVIKTTDQVILYVYVC